MRIVQDCVGWTTTTKKGALVSDGGASSRPVALSAGQPVRSVTEGSAPPIALDVFPRSVFVVTDQGETVEVRERFVGL